MKKFFAENKDYIQTSLLIITAVLLLMNSVKLGTMGDVVPFASANNNEITDSTDIKPTGVPDVYGEELGVSFDQVSPYNQQLANQVIQKLSNLDRNIQLNAEQKQRYIDVLYNLEGGISCEYCCSARSVIFENGRAACGCAHSYAMRGLAKYLITEHGDEFTDMEILEEVGKWKILFFPTQHEEKAQVMEDKGMDVNYVSLTSNKNRGIQSGFAGGGMVGGC